ncbi:MAG: hypothetical protein LAO22_04735 [Acidobacteriia bacterium]|nr:hypothetical protein [Terriglobia bacterium]
MKFAVLPKFALLAVLACAFAFTGCGFLNNSNSAKLTAGNWSFIATSTVTPGPHLAEPFKTSKSPLRPQPTRILR